MRCGNLVGLVDGLYQVIFDETVDAQPNAFINPGFETGSVVPWLHTAGFGTDIVLSGNTHSGNFSGNCTFGESPPQRVYQNVIAFKSYLQGRTSSFKIWINMAYRTIPVMKLYYQSNFGPSGEGTLINGNDTWQQYSLNIPGTFDNGGTTTYINIGVIAYDNNVYPVRIDDAEIIIPGGQTEFNVTGLEGDSDESYKIFTMIKSAYNTTFRMTLNGDTSALYGCQHMSASGLVPSAVREDAQPNFNLMSLNTNEIGLIEANMYSKSAYGRSLLFKKVAGISGTTVNEVSSAAAVYNEPDTEITSIRLYSDSLYGLDAGSRLIVLKKVTLSDAASTKVGSVDAPAIVEGMWQQIYEYECIVDTNSIEITGLDGDEDEIYKVIYKGRAGDYPGDVQLILNGDTASNYGMQYLKGYSTTVSADQITQSYVKLGSHSVGTIYELDPKRGCLSEALLYAKSGAERACIVLDSSEIWHHHLGNQQVFLRGQSWNNTASNITSMTIRGAGLNGLAEDSKVSLFRLVKPDAAPSDVSATVEQISNVITIGTTIIGSYVGDSSEGVPEDTLLPAGYYGAEGFGGARIDVEVTGLANLTIQAIAIDTWSNSTGGATTVTMWVNGIEVYNQPATWGTGSHNQNTYEFYEPATPWTNVTSIKYRLNASTSWRTVRVYQVLAYELL